MKHRDLLTNEPTHLTRIGLGSHLSYRYFIEMVQRLRNVRPEDLTENSVLLGTPAQIIETLKRVEAAGFDEVILCFNVGLKPHPQVKNEMARFMTEVAPAFG
jgi:alkanesulfonate monooxygenase SsuD/methylene tetrahydromethanopterin reductase-like flavin-dependent oxidoreductase (luciferase family)